MYGDDELNRHYYLYEKLCDQHWDVQIVCIFIGCEQYPENNFQNILIFFPNPCCGKNFLHNYYISKNWIVNRLYISVILIKMNDLEKKFQIYDYFFQESKYQ